MSTTSNHAPKNIVCDEGIRPTGFLHLGNYFGAIWNYVRMQESYECYFMVADLHSLTTTHPDTKYAQIQVYRVLAENIACGLDPEKAACARVFMYRKLLELYLYLNMLAYKGELEKRSPLKINRQHPDNVNAGLLTYPLSCKPRTSSCTGPVLCLWEDQ